MAKNVFIKKTSRGKLQTWTWQCGGKLHFSSCGSISRRLYVCMDVCMYIQHTYIHTMPEILMSTKQKDNLLWCGEGRVEKILYFMAGVGVGMVLPYLVLNPCQLLATIIHIHISRAGSQVGILL